MKNNKFNKTIFILWQELWRPIDKREKRFTAQLLN